MGAPSGYLGCFTDRDYPKRQLNGTSNFEDDVNMTNQECIAHCAALGFPLAGTEYDRECYCGQYLNQTDHQPAGGNNCQYSCFGDKTQMCGGSWQISVYSTNNGTAVLYGSKPAGTKRRHMPAWKRHNAH